MEWLGIFLVAVGGVMLSVLTVVVWMDGFWLLGLMLGVFAVVALVCVGCMAKITLRG